MFDKSFIQVFNLLREEKGTIFFEADHANTLSSLRIELNVILGFSGQQVINGIFATTDNEECYVKQQV